MDLRERILTSYDQREGTREEIAQRYRVSLGMVKKLLQQRRRTGDLRPRHHGAGRKPLMVDTHRRRVRELLGKQPDLTLKELRLAVGLRCTLPAIHYALDKLGLTYKKRHSEPASRIVRTSPEPAGLGGVGKPVSIRRA